MGLYDSEIVSISTNTTKALQDFPNNMHNRPDTTAESLAKLRPAFSVAARNGYPLHWMWSRYCLRSRISMRQGDYGIWGVK